jgi:hypothetical protein
MEGQFSPTNNKEHTMKTYPISARIINRTTGINKTIPVVAKTIQANGGWWFFEIEYDGDTVFSDHGEQTKSGLLETASNDVMEFVL